MRKALYSPRLALVLQRTTLGDSSRYLIGAADNELLEAERLGRNRVECAIN